jgi:hypothetical protein
MLSCPGELAPDRPPVRDAPPPSAVVCPVSAVLPAEPDDIDESRCSLIYPLKSSTIKPYRCDRCFTPRFDNARLSLLSAR